MKNNDRPQISAWLLGIDGNQAGRDQTQSPYHGTPQASQSLLCSATFGNRYE